VPVLLCAPSDGRRDRLAPNRAPNLMETRSRRVCFFFGPACGN
jgi:hypothetical protein